MTIGIPKALLYYKYNRLWKNFFSYLDINTITSPNTNKEILEDGIKSSIDEACLSMKIYLGHVKSLINKCDYILVPRIVSLKKYEKTCTNFYALYDIVKNTYNTKILNYNVDVSNNIDEEKAFINMAKTLGIDKQRARKAYKYAKEKESDDEKYKVFKQKELLKDENIKILIAGHPYNIYDELVGKPILDYLKSQKITVLKSDIFEKNSTKFNCSCISKDIYWTYNKEILSSINYYLDQVDGIILLSAFPCGPDSLCNEIIIRKIKNKPIITLIIDELNNNVGLITRLESFIDIIKDKKERRKAFEKNN